MADVNNTGAGEEGQLNKYQTPLALRSRPNFTAIPYIPIPAEILTIYSIVTCKNYIFGFNKNPLRGTNPSM